MNLRSLNSSRRFIPITLVGPPSQYSHLRPVRFATPEDNRKSHKHHPYEPTTSDFYDYTAEELSFDLSRRRLDTFNERFWSDNNIRCEQALKAYVGDSAGEERELLLQKFWKDWAEANKTRYYNWSKEWWKSQLSLLWPAFKISYNHLIRRIF